MEVIIRLRLKNNDNVFIGKGVRMMLDAIDKYNSISEASRQTGISYPKAIRMIKTLEQELGFEVVNSKKGGHLHGGSCLTEKGKKMLLSYSEIEDKLTDYAKKLVEENFDY